MADKPFIDHKQLKAWIEESGSAKTLLADRSLVELLEPVTPARIEEDGVSAEYKGYLAAADGRIAFRVVGQNEAQAKFGVDALSTRESVFASLRIAQLVDVEEAALACQRENVLITRAFTDILYHLEKGVMPPARAVSKARALLNSFKAES